MTIWSDDGLAVSESRTQPASASSSRRAARKPGKDGEPISSSPSTRKVMRRGEVGAPGEQAGEGHEGDQVRALVVSRPATPDTPVANLGLEGGGGPEVEGVGRLDVVMTVKDDMRPVGGPATAAEDDGVEGRGDDLDLEAGPPHHVAKVLAGADHALGERRVGRDARVAHVGEQFLHEIHGPRLGEGGASGEPKRALGLKIGGLPQDFKACSGPGSSFVSWRAACWSLLGWWACSSP